MQRWRDNLCAHVARFVSQKSLAKNLCGLLYSILNAKTFLVELIQVGVVHLQQCAMVRMGVNERGKEMSQLALHCDRQPRFPRGSIPDPVAYPPND